MKKITLACLALFLLGLSNTKAQPGSGGTPGGGIDDCIASNTNTGSVLFTEWWFNLTDEENENGDLVNVQEVWYDDDYIYIVTEGIPDYAEYGVSKFDAVAQSVTRMIPRSPSEDDSATEISGEGEVGIFLDGSAVMSPGDGNDYNGWYSLAPVFEGAFDFDSYGGHGTAGGQYHHHEQNTAYPDLPNGHSPLVGFAFDGYPIYGPYGFSDSLDKNSPVVRIESSYQIRQDLLDAGTRGVDGPPVTSSVTKNTDEGPLGAYEEDYEFIAGLGHLDDHNGRWCVTPEYPQGTYAYFSTIDDTGEPSYPYFVGPSYYGVYDSENSPKNNPATSTCALEFDPSTVTNTSLVSNAEMEFSITPTLTKDFITVSTLYDTGNISISDLTGQLVFSSVYTSNSTEVPVSNLPEGVYIVVVENDEGDVLNTQKFIKL